MVVYVFAMPEVDLFGNPVLEERHCSRKKAEAREET
jgi:hypothetical protein